MDFRNFLNFRIVECKQKLIITTNISSKGLKDKLPIGRFHLNGDKGP